MAKPLAVDFTGVESGGRIRLPEDDYRVKVKSVKQTESQAGNAMLVWEFEISDGKFAGKVIRDRTTLTPQSLWRLKNLLEAMGISVPSKRVALDLRKYVGNELGITVTDDEYEGKISSKVSDYVSVDVLDEVDDEDEDDEDEEEEPAPKKSKKGKKGKKAKPADDDEEIEDLDLDEI